MSDVCHQCRVGRTQPINTTFLMEFKSTVLIMPKAPAFACDVCDFMVYDPDFLRNFSYLLDQHAAPERAKKAKDLAFSGWRGAV